MIKFPRLMGSVLLLAAAGSANAALITDTLDFSPNQLITGTPFDYAHDITDDGFVPGTDTALTADLTLTVANDFGVVNVTLLLADGVLQGGGFFDVVIGDNTVGIGVGALNDDGVANMQLAVVAGGPFFLDVSSLAVEVAQAPEPATVGLLSMGLLMLGRFASARRRSGKSLPA